MIGSIVKAAVFVAVWSFCLALLLLWSVGARLSERLGQ